MFVSISSNSSTLSRTACTCCESSVLQSESRGSQGLRGGHCFSEMEEREGTLTDAAAGVEAGAEAAAETGAALTEAEDPAVGTAMSDCAIARLMPACTAAAEAMAGLRLIWNLFITQRIS